MSLPRKPEELQATIAIPQMLEHSTETRPSEPDRENNPDIRTVHYRDVDVSIDGKLHHFTLVVKETRQGQQFYDRYIEREKAQPTKPEGASITGSLPDSGSAMPSPNSIAPSAPPVKGDSPNAKYSISSNADYFRQPEPAKPSLVQKAKGLIAPDRQEGERFSLRKEDKAAAFRRKIEDEFLPIRRTTTESKAARSPTKTMSECT